MTVGIAIKCGDGVIMACDSLSTFGRGVPIARYTNKVHIIEHSALRHPVALIGAGMTTFVDKFIDRSKRLLTSLEQNESFEKLDIIDFAEKVCETIGSYLFKEYVIDRYQFFGTKIMDYSISLIIAGATKNGELRAYYVDGTGLTESIDDFGTIGSGAAYAELFLRHLIPDLKRNKVDRIGCLASYAIKGVEIMDPYVGGETSCITLQMTSEQLKIKHFAKSKIPKNAKKKMEEILNNIGKTMHGLIK